MDDFQDDSSDDYSDDLPIIIKWGVENSGHYAGIFPLSRSNLNTHVDLLND